MFTGSLYQSQIPGAQFLCAKKNAILAWEQGTGKTIISIASAEKLLDLKLIKRILVLAPSAIAWQWCDKVEEFTDNETTLIHAKSGLRGTYATTTPYTITSYELFRRDFSQIANQRWDLVICDEAQAFKNNKAKLAKLLKELNQQVEPAYKWALTGTVISNKLEELYSIMYWVDKTFFPSWHVFEKRHIVRNPKTNQIMQYKGIQVISNSLPRRLNRRTQEDIGDMPELVRTNLYVEKHKELKDAEKELLEALDDLAELHINGDGTLAPTHSPEVSKAFSAVRAELASPWKISLTGERCHQGLMERGDNRIVVFSTLKSPLARLQQVLNGYSIDSYYFTGDQTSEQKRASVRLFKENPSVLLCSNAGKAGLDLPFANYLFHLDVPFSFEVIDQRDKRITRASSKFRTVKANLLLVKNSMEEYYYKQLKAKERLSNAVYDGDLDTVVMKTQSLRGWLDDKLRNNVTAEGTGVPPPKDT